MLEFVEEPVCGVAEQWRRPLSVSTVPFGHVWTKADDLLVYKGMMHT